QVRRAERGAYRSPSQPRGPSSSGDAGPDACERTRGTEDTEMRRARGRLGARSDRTGCDTDPRAVTLLVHVRVQSFLLRSIGEHGVCGAAVDQGNVTENADVDVVHSEILEGARLSDVVEELGTVASDPRKLRDEVFAEELAEAFDIAELVGVEEILVEPLENRHILGGLLGVVHVLAPSLCASAFAAGGLSCRCRGLALDLQGHAIASSVWRSENSQVQVRRAQIGHRTTPRLLSERCGAPCGSHNTIVRPVDRQPRSAPAVIRTAAPEPWGRLRARARPGPHRTVQPGRR